MLLLSVVSLVTFLLKGNLQLCTPPKYFENVIFPLKTLERGNAFNYNKMPWFQMPAPFVSANFDEF